MAREHDLRINSGDDKFAGPYSTHKGAETRYRIGRRMSVKKGQELEVTVTDLAFGGKGLVRIDGLAVFVDQAVPLDRALIRIMRKKKRHAEARVIRLIDPSPHRVRPPCPYSGTCGGCKWQFLDYDRQIQYKRSQVIESLEHIAMIRDVTVHSTIPSDPVFGYRNKMEFSCSDRRWLLPEELGKPDIKIGSALGLHVPGTFHKVLDIEACLLQPNLGNILLGEVRQYIQESELPIYGLKSHEGFWRFLMLRHSVAHDRWMVNIVTAEENREAVFPLARRLTADHPEVVSVVNNITSRKAGVAVGEYEVPMAGESCLTDRIGDLEFEISANSFFQTNTRSAGRLYETVKGYAGLTGRESVVDLYSGTGTISLFLAKSARTVTGLEIVESAISDARKNCRRNQIANCTFIAGDIRESLKEIQSPPDLLVIDPPRAGMHKDVVRQVIDMAPERIIYVSCNPATLARDLFMIKDRYEVKEVQPVDMFPHTFHIESVARLERKCT